jgi:uncharacterized membrane protein YhhN
MVLIIILCGITSPQISVDFKYLILLGLLFSIVGDIFLMLKSNQFTKGLLSFLIAHLFYLTAIIVDSNFQFSLLLFVIVFIYFISISLIIFPKSGSKKLYVLIYTLVISILLWQSFERMEILGTDATKLLAFGNLLFTISDSVLAYNKFVRKFSTAQLVILSTYFAAQTLIALSV